MSNIQFGMFIAMLVIQFAFITFHLAKMTGQLSYMETMMKLMQRSSK